MLITAEDRNKWKGFSNEQIRIFKETNCSSHFTPTQLKYINNKSLTPTQIRAALEFLTADLTLKQINDGLALIKNITLDDLFEEKLSMILKAFKSNLTNEEINLFINDTIEIKQSKQILLGLLNPLVRPYVSIYAISNVPWESMEQLRFALEIQLDPDQIKFMVVSNLKWDQIMQVTSGFMQGLTIEQMKICVFDTSRPYIRTFDPDQIKELENVFLSFLDNKHSPELSPEQVRFYARENLSSTIINR